MAWLILNNGFLECRAADGSEEKIFGQKIKPDAGRDFACFENDVQRMRYLRIIADKLGKMACL